MFRKNRNASIEALAVIFLVLLECHCNHSLKLYIHSSLRSTRSIHHQKVFNNSQIVFSLIFDRQLATSDCRREGICDWYNRLYCMAKTSLPQIRRLQARRLLNHSILTLKCLRKGKTIELEEGEAHQCKGQVEIKWSNYCLSNALTLRLINFRGMFFRYLLT